MSPLFGPKPGKILETGTPVQGRIVGISRQLTHDDPPVRNDDYAVEADGRLYGVRQNLRPAEDVRLGMTLTLRTDGDAAVIDWGDIDIHRWKSLKNPPAAGIVDDTDPSGNRGGLSKARSGGKGVTATVLELSTRSVALGLGTALDARCRIEPAGGDPYEATIPKISPPGYAAHLLVVGAALPAWEKSGFTGTSLVVDWPAAAMADPGIGRPAADRLDRPGAASSAMSMGGATPGTPAPAGGTTPAAVDDPVPWETYLKIEHEIAWAELKKNAIEPFAISLGVPPGEWPAAQRRWQERASNDPSLAMAFGQAMSRP